MSVPIVAVAVFSPLDRLFDYEWLVDAPPPRVGQLLRVPLGRRLIVGVLIAIKETSDFSPLKPITAVCDTAPLLRAADLALLSWVSEYYQYPLGEVIATALPKWWRQGKSAGDLYPPRFQLSALGEALGQTNTRAKQQQALLQWVKTAGPCTLSDMVAAGFSHAVIRAVRAKEAFTEVAATAQPISAQLLADSPLTLTTAQAEVLSALGAQACFRVSLLEGVTGSGKTEIYLQWMAQFLAQGKQVLVLVPEIALTPQTEARFRRRFALPVVCLHSELTDKARAQAWWSARQGDARIVIGTRSAVFVPLPQLAAIIVDEEHDSAFSQQSGLRYMGRDVAVMRAKQCDVPILLGSATPSLESLHNVAQGRYQHLQLLQRATGQALPAWSVLDIRGQELEAGLSEALLKKLAEQLHAGRQVMLFLNRRGFAPILLCHHCGWRAQCQHCDAHMTLHHSPRRVVCHHCGAGGFAAKICPDCQQADLDTMGIGTEQLEQALRQRFPKEKVVRIDRDTTQTRGQMQDFLQQAVSGEARILLGTQMLAKGHHFPHLSLVAILQADQGFFSSDFRAMEQMAQLWWQVAGRAGRAKGCPGTVVLQTHCPDESHLQLLLARGYAALAQQLLSERAQAGLPPYCHWVKWIVEAKQPVLAQSWLKRVKALCEQANTAQFGLQCFGPMPALMEKRAGYYHYELVLQAGSRASLHQQVAKLRRQVQAWRPQSGLRWYLLI
jgi:primosomal protein N' (replication factor Y)